jgi:hypothetical protein
MVPGQAPNRNYLFVNTSFVISFVLNFSQSAILVLRQGPWIFAAEISPGI